MLSMTPTKHYTLTEGEAIITYNILGVAKKIIPYSDLLSAREASIYLKQIDSVERVLISQVDTSSVKK